MIIDIHDVGHGACSVVTFSNGARFMIDAGSRCDPFWAPSIEYFGQNIDLLLLQNLDSDHLSDIEHLLRCVNSRAIRTNPTINHNALAFMKQEHGMNSALKVTHQLLRQFGSDIGPRPDIGIAWGTAFWNRYGVDFWKTNNLSLPVFLGYGPFTVLFGGDLETEGWEVLLRNPAFRAHLAKVTVYVAAHHGRDNGRCEGVFDVCKPQVTIISDSEHQYLTQQTGDWYRERTSGIPDYTRRPTIGDPCPTRYVLTTRNDGSMRIVVEPNGRYSITRQFAGLGAPTALKAG